MSQVWQIVQAHIDAYGPSEAEVARRMGTSPQTLNSWKKRGLKKLPDAHLLLGLARVASVPYKDVLEAALHDIRYLPEEVVDRDQRSAPIVTEDTNGDEGQPGGQPGPSDIESMLAPGRQTLADRPRSTDRSSAKSKGSRKKEQGS